VAPAKGPRADRDVSVNHAFSRQFFEALAHHAADDAGAEFAVRDAPAAVVDREPGLQGRATPRPIASAATTGWGDRDAQMRQSSGMILQL